MNKEKLQRGLGLFLDAMRPYAVSIITRECPEGRSWDVDFEQKIDSERQRTSWQMQRMQLNNKGSSLLGLIDNNNLVTFIINYKESVGLHIVPAPLCAVNCRITRWHPHSRGAGG